MVVRHRAATAAIAGTLLLLSAHEARAEPKTASAVVRLIYLVPSDRSVHHEYVKRLEAAAEHLQIWTRDQLDNGTTFSLPKHVVAQTPFFSPVDLKRSLGACAGKP